jgi:hypothetical protein
MDCKDIAVHFELVKFVDASISTTFSLSVLQVRNPGNIFWSAIGISKW